MERFVPSQQHYCAVLNFYIRCATPETSRIDAHFNYDGRDVRNEIPDSISDRKNRFPSAGTETRGYPLLQQGHFAVALQLLLVLRKFQGVILLSLT